jgi:hypothetical protein
MTLHAPQLILLALILLGTGIHLAKNGEPRDDTWSFGKAMFSNIVFIGLLYWGGFFTP